MTERDLGVSLVWLGTLCLMAALLYRIGRNGVFRSEGDDIAPPPRWLAGGALAAALVAVGGAALTLRSFL